MTQDELKRAAAEAAVSHIRDGMLLGLGSGSTAEIALKLIGERVAKGLKVAGVPTSERVAGLSRGYNIPLKPLDGTPIDLVIDGADEIETGSLALIKGGGGALIREKLVARAAKLVCIVADDSKLSPRVGTIFALPIALLPFAQDSVLAALKKFGSVSLRQKAGKDFVSDDGCLIADCRTGPIADAARLEAEIDAIPGVVGCGLFLNLASEALVAGAGGVTTLKRR